MFLVTPIRSKWCIAFTSLFLSHLLMGYSIVFIHLGKAIPDHLFEATHQARKFNADAKLMVIAEQRAIAKIDTQLLHKDEVEFISCEALHETEEHRIFKKTSSLNKNFREGFWVKSIERFFYLDELMQQRDLHDVFHLEYDNMLYVNLKEMLPAFHTYKNIAMTFHNDDICVAGFMYIARPQALHVLVSYMAHVAHKGLSDMKVISQIRKQASEMLIENLPTIMPEYIEQFGLKSKKGHRASKPEQYICNINTFDSIFDGAALGQFLGGVDPWHGIKDPSFTNPSCLFDASKLTYTWHEDENGRKVPYVSCGQKLYRINNLHIHSKNLKAFAS